MDPSVQAREDFWERKGLRLKRHFASSTRRMRQEALAREGYDPAQLYKWGQMMALAVIRMMDAAERHFGREVQRALSQSLVELGREIGQEILEGFYLEPGIPVIQAVSAFVTYVNEEIWASPERPAILDQKTCSCEVLWCPHQDHYSAFDCRVQRYIVQGLLEALEEKTGIRVDAKFTQIIPKGAETCRFEIRIMDPGEEREWTRYSQELATKALQRAEASGAGL